MKYSDQLVDWLVEEGYTHCFYVAGGNIMHLLNSVRSRMECIPVIHEVAAGVAAEYFTEVSQEAKAFALVTAGPGLTNILTAMAGAFLESRELLVIGGQVKSMDLATDGLRQRGIQEINGIALANPVAQRTLQIRTPIPKREFVETIRVGPHARKGPVFIEVCLDAQAAETKVNRDAPNNTTTLSVLDVDELRPQAKLVAQWLRASERPLLLLGGGLSRASTAGLLPRLREIGIPIATTWNAADRIDSADPLYFGRPNTWGMRHANILLQQSDFIVALGTRLGMQQTGFNWQQFGPMARIVQVDVDDAELRKGHPRIDLGVCGDATAFLELVIDELTTQSANDRTSNSWSDWLAFGKKVKRSLPIVDPLNVHAPNFIDPFEFVLELSRNCIDSDVIVPCSSGGAFTSMMQAFQQRAGQVIVTNKGLASMGYGLSGAIGAAIARRQARTVLVEGDGGFAQTLQETGTVVAQGLNLKVFIFSNSGYASIRMTQRNYFYGAYMGCDTKTGLGLPDWETLFESFGMPVVVMDPITLFAGRVRELFDQEGPAAFIVPVDPEQTYYPKINSRITESGTMESAPLHVMFPDLDEVTMDNVMPYLTRGSQE